MLHHPKRIRSIEVWSRRLAWLALFSGVISFVILIIIKLTNPAQTEPYYHSYSQTLLSQARSFILYIQPLANTAATFLLLMGVSLVTRLLRGYYQTLSIPD